MRWGRGGPGQRREGRELLRPKYPHCWIPASRCHESRPPLPEPIVEEQAGGGEGSGGGGGRVEGGGGRKGGEEGKENNDRRTPSQYLLLRNLAIFVLVTNSYAIVNIT